MKKTKRSIPSQVYAPGLNPAGIATRFGPGGRPPPKRDPGPEPPEDPAWRSYPDSLRDMLWVTKYDDRWDNQQRKFCRELMRDKPGWFLTHLFK
jgi:hypothetical protein